MLKSERYTSKYLNKSKLDFIKATDASVRRLKNSMSLFCHENIIQLVADKNFQVNYKSFKMILSLLGKPRLFSGHHQILQEQLFSESQEC